MSEQKYLILGATGRQGSAVVDAMITKNVSIVASSRSPLSLSKQRGKYYIPVVSEIEQRVFYSSFIQTTCTNLSLHNRENY